MSKRILFFGNERLATGVATSATTLQSLISAGYDVAALVVAQQPPGNGRQPRLLESAAVAKAAGVPVLAPTRLSQAKAQLAAYRAEAAVLVAYGKIVPQSIIDIFPAGIINIHPSLLPRHRGPTPIESVILAGETATGVSLMQLSSEMDAGPVYAQSDLKLVGNETKQDLADQLLTLGAQLMISHLPAILSGQLKPKPQLTSGVSYDKKIIKTDGQLDWQLTANQLERQIRAYAGWPKCHTKLMNSEVIITTAQVVARQGPVGKLLIESGRLGIYCQSGVLMIDRLIPAGKREMTAQAFLAGHTTI